MKPLTPNIGGAKPQGKAAAFPSLTPPAGASRSFQASQMSNPAAIQQFRPNLEAEKMQRDREDSDLAAGQRTLERIRRGGGGSGGERTLNGLSVPDYTKQQQRQRDEMTARAAKDLGRTTMRGAEGGLEWGESDDYVKQAREQEREKNRQKMLEDRQKAAEAEAQRAEGAIRDQKARAEFERGAYKPKTDIQRERLDEKLRQTEAAAKAALGDDLDAARSESPDHPAIKDLDRLRGEIAADDEQRQGYESANARARAEEAKLLGIDKPRMVAFQATAQAGELEREIGMAHSGVIAASQGIQDLEESHQQKIQGLRDGYRQRAAQGMTAFEMEDAKTALHAAELEAEKAYQQKRRALEDAEDAAKIDLEWTKKQADQFNAQEKEAIQTVQAPPIKLPEDGNLIPVSKEGDKLGKATGERFAINAQMRGAAEARQTANELANGQEMGWIFDRIKSGEISADEGRALYSKQMAKADEAAQTAEETTNLAIGDAITAAIAGTISEQELGAVYESIGLTQADAAAGLQETKDAQARAEKGIESAAKFALDEYSKNYTDHLTLGGKVKDSYEAWYKGVGEAVRQQLVDAGITDEIGLRQLVGSIRRSAEENRTKTAGDVWRASRWKHFWGYTKSVDDGLFYKDLILAINKVSDGEQLSWWEAEQMQRFLQDQGRETTMGADIMGPVLQLPAFAQEFMASGPLALSARASIKGTEKAALKLIETVGRKKVGQYLKKYVTGQGLAGFSKKFASKAAAKAVEASIRFPASMGARVVAGTIENVARDQMFNDEGMARIGFDADGQAQVLEAIPQVENLIGPALAHSVGDNYIEMLSELSGGALTMTAAPLRKKMLATAWAQAFAKKTAALGIKPDKIARAMQAVGYHGIAEEFFEEQVGRALRMATGIEELRMPTLEELAVELAVVSVPGGAFAVANEAMVRTQNASADRQLAAARQNTALPASAAEAAEKANAFAAKAGVPVQVDAYTAELAQDIIGRDGSPGTRQIDGTIAALEEMAKGAPLNERAQITRQMAALESQRADRYSADMLSAAGVAQEIEAERAGGVAMREGAQNDAEMVEANGKVRIADLASAAIKIGAGQEMEALTSAEQAALAQPMPSGNPPVDLSGGTAIVGDELRDAVLKAFPGAGRFLRMTETQARQFFAGRQKAEAKAAQPKESPKREESPAPAAGGQGVSAEPAGAAAAIEAPAPAAAADGGYWTAQGQDGTKVRIPAKGIGSQIQAEEALAAKLPRGEMLDRDSVEQVAPKPKVTPIPETPAAQAQPEAAAPNFRAQIDRAIGESVAAPNRKAAQFAADTLAPLADAYGKVFEGGIRFAPLEFGTGFAYMPDSKALQIDINRVAKAVSKNGAREAYIRAAIREELIHRVAAEAIPAEQVAQLWIDLGNSAGGKKLQRIVSEAYFAGNPPAELQPYMMGHEFLRMIVQDAKFAGQITEMQDLDPTMKGRIIRLLRQLAKALNRAVERVPAELRAEIEQYQALIGERLDQLTGKTAAKEDAAQKQREIEARKAERERKRAEAQAKKMADEQAAAKGEIKPRSRKQKELLDWAKANNIAIEREGDQWAVSQPGRETRLFEKPGQVFHSLRGRKEKRTFSIPYAPSGAEDIIDKIVAMGGIKPKAEMRHRQGEYDDAPELRGIYGQIVQGTLTPDKAATALGMEIPAMWAEVGAAIDRRMGAVREPDAEDAYYQKRIEETEAQDKQFAKDNKPGKGKRAIPVSSLKVGDQVELDGHPLKVISIDPDTEDVTLEDGKTYGLQRLEDGDLIYAQKADIAEPASDFLPDEDGATPFDEPTKPAKPAPKPKPAKARDAKVDEIMEAVKTPPQRSNSPTPFPPESGTLGIPRDQMPQIKSEHRGAMVNFLNARGVKSSQVEMDPAAIKPTQAEFFEDKVQKAIDRRGEGDRSILVSRDNHALDGHHQLIAAQRAAPGEKIKVIKFSAPIRDLMPLAHEFPSSESEAKPDNDPAFEWLKRLHTGEFESSNDWAKAMPVSAAKAVIETASAEYKDLESRLQPNTGVKLVGQAKKTQVAVLNGMRKWQGIMAVIQYEHGEKLAALSKKPDFTLEAQTDAQIQEEKRQAAEKAKADAQKQAMQDKAAAPLRGDSSNVGQGALFAEDADLLSGPSAEELNATFPGIDRAAEPEMKRKPPAQAEPEAQEAATEAQDQAEEAAALADAPQKRPASESASPKGTGIHDFGERIEGARKHEARKLGKRAKSTDPDKRPAWMKQYIAMDEAKQPGSRTNGWRIYKAASIKRKGPIAVRPAVYETFLSEEAALAAVPRIEVDSNHRIAEKDGEFSIYRIVGRGKYPTVKGGFKSREQARDYMLENAAEIIEHKFPFPTKPYLDEIQRTGADVRGGRDISPRQFQEEFGFRGGQFGNWQTNKDGQASLNYAYEAFHDLAKVINVPPKAMSLHGKLAMAFGARGHGGIDAAAAHYEPDKAVINLTKIKGAGTLAHEWFHALDHYFGTGLSAEGRKGKGTKSEKARSTYATFGRQQDMRPELAEKFKALLKTMQRKEGETVVRGQTDNMERMRGYLNSLLDGVRATYATAEKNRYNKRWKQPPEKNLKRFDALIEKLRAEAVKPDGGALGEKVMLPSQSKWVLVKVFPEIIELSDLYKKTVGRSLTAGKYDSTAVNLTRQIEALQDAAKRAATDGETITVPMPTDFLRNAKEIDQYRASDYWSSVHEMGARAFESYIFDTLRGRDQRSDYLVQATENKFFAFLGMKPYPEGEERAAINKAFSEFIAEIKSDPDGRLFAGQRLIKNIPTNSRGERIYSAVVSLLDGKVEATATNADYEKHGAHHSLLFPRQRRAIEEGEMAWITYDDGWRDEFIPASWHLPESGKLKLREFDSEIRRQLNMPPKQALFAGQRPLVEPGFYSALAEAVEQKLPARSTPDQAKAAVRKAQGVKPEELKWVGYDGIVDRLAAENGGKVPADALAAAVREQAAAMFKVVDSRVNQEDGNQYAKYQLPGGENYREVVLAMPEENYGLPDGYSIFKSENGSYGVQFPDGIKLDGWTTPELAAASQRQQNGGAYRSLHFNHVPNYVAHIRLNERPDADGEPGLFIEEIQSDRHQKGRKSGYVGDIPTDDQIRDFFKLTSDANPADFREEMMAHKDFQDKTPDAPYRKDWPLAMFKRALRDAAESGKAWVGWTVGETQNERYDLSKQVHRVLWEPREGGRGNLRVLGKESNTLLDQEMPADKVEDYIGKEAATRLFARPVEKSKFFPDTQILDGDGLKVGGKGMRGFYDGMLPKEVAKYVKQWGGKVVKGEVPADGATPIWRVEITPEMRTGVSEGQALFAGARPGAIYVSEPVRDEADSPDEPPLHRVIVGPSPDGRDAAFVSESSDAPTRASLRDLAKQNGFPEGFSIKRVGPEEYDSIYNATFPALYAGARVTPQQDAEYMAAVERGDMDAAQAMVDAAAKAAGYDFEGWHGKRGNWNFDTFDTSKEGGAHFGTKAQAEMRGGSGNARRFYLRFEGPSRLRDKGQFKRIPIGKDAAIYLNRYEGISLETVKSIPSSKLDRMTDAQFRKAVPESKDSVVVKNSWQIKSADPVTRDAAGNVIPLSQRFNERSDSILYAGSRDPFEAIRRLEAEMDASLPTEIEMASIRARALGEKFGERTAGDPDLANPAATEETRREFDAVREARRLRMEAETHEEWNEEARKRIAKDRGGFLTQILDKIAEGQTLDKIEVKGAQMLVAGEMAAAVASRDYDRLKRAQALAYAYDKSGTEQGRAFAARRDPHKTRSARNLEFVAKTILKPTAEEEKRAADLPTEAQKAREIARLEQQIKAAEGDKRRIRQLERELKDAKAQQAREGMLADAAKARLDKIEEQFAKMGISLHDIFNNRAVVRLRGSAIVKGVLEAFAPKERSALRLMVDGVGNRRIAKETGIGRKALEGVEDRFDAAMRAELGKWVDRGFTLADFELLDEGGQFDLSQVVDEGGALRAGPRPQNAEERQKRIDEIMKALKPTREARNSGRIKRFKKKAGAGYGFDPDSQIHAVQAARAANAIANANRFDMVFEYWVNGILSGPQTHVANITGNFTSAAWDMTVQRGMEALVNGLVFRDKSAAQFGEIPIMWKSLLAAIPKAWRMASQSYGSEVDLFSSTYMDEPVSLMGDDKAGNVRGAIPGRLGRVVRIPGRALLLMDAFFKTAIAEGEVAAQAYRIAKAEGLEGAEMERRIDGLVNLQGSAAWVAAVDKAKELTFTNELRSFQEGGGIAESIVKRIQDGRNSRTIAPAGRFVIGLIFPFIRTPFRIFQMGLRKSPLGAIHMANQTVRGLYRMRNGVPFFESYPKALMAKHLSEQILGGVALAFLWGAIEGDPDDDDKPLLITGNRPFKGMESGERDLETRRHGGANQIIIGGKDGLRIDYGRIEPLATLLGTTVDMIRGVKDMERGKDKAEAIGQQLEFFVAQSQDKTFLQGLAKIGFILHTGGRYVADEVKKTILQGAIPNIIRQPMRNLDPVARDTKNAPFWYQMLPYGGFAEPAYDLYGQPMEKEGSGITRTILDLPLKPAPDAPADEAIRNYALQNPEEAYFPTRNFRITQFTDPATGEKVDMNAAEIAELNRVAGRAFANEARAIFPPGTSARPTPEQMRDLQALRNRIWRETRDQMFRYGRPKPRPKKELNLTDALRAAS